ncbi:hypothetical protein [Providencia huashanensis]|uniref:hypothetical protein n=1 Tax=Providencia huashanensis TaxID=3037798 RepID=UPI0040456411
MNFIEIMKNFIKNTLIFGGFVVSVVACIYSIKAYNGTREIAFPQNDAHITAELIGSFTKEGENFLEFLGNNVNRVVYINIILDDASISVDENKRDSNYADNIDKNENNYFTIWDICGDDYKQGDDFEYPQCTGTTIAVIDSENSDSNLYWYRGNFRLQGYFSVLDYYGPYQGMMGVTLRGEKIR